MPNPPVALSISGTTLGHPERLRTAFTIRQSAKASVVFMAPKFELSQFTPFALKENVGASFDTDDERDAQLLE